MAINVKKGGAYSAVNSISVKKGGTYRAIADMFVKTAGAYQSVSFSPMALFTTGVNGAWYDPSDFSTLFQDAAGTTPVTAVGQPVGLMLDKSKGLVLGPEKWTTNPTIDANWTKNGDGSFTSNGNSGFITVAINGVTVNGKWYKATMTIKSATAGLVSIPYDGTSPKYYGSAGTYTWYFPADADGGLYIYASGFAGTIDNISVRELPGNHAFNPSGNSANFPVLSARYNLLTKTEDFSDAVWTKSSCTITPNATTAPDGTLTADRAVFTAGGLLYANGLPATAGAYIFSGYVKSATGSAQTMRIFGNGTLSYSGNLTVTTEWTQVSFTFTYSSVTSGFATSSGQPLDIYIWGADLRVANDALNQPAYQRVNTATDYDTVGFKPYLSFNGVNQWLQTNSIDFTYGDKMFVSAGVRKLSDAASGHLVELSATIDSNNGSFVLAAPSTPNHYVLGSKGTIAKFSIVSSGYSAPITNVISGIGNISGDLAILRANGTQVASASPGQGTGNYSNYPLYIGARAGSSLWFNGRLYGLVVAGKAASASEIASTESWLNQKTGAY